MTTQTIRAIRKSLSKPDEVREFPNGRVEFVHLEDVTVIRATLLPGWRWSRDLQSLGASESCMASHTQYVLSGRLRIVMDDGSEFEVRAGDVMAVPPCQDAYVVGDQSVVVVDFAQIKH